jgi:signal transduction histidine kinase
MERNRRGTLIYSLLLGVWALVIVWQIEEHSRVQEAAKRDLRSRSTEIGNNLSAVMRGFSLRGRQVLQRQLEPVLNELVNGQTNELFNSGGLIFIALLNTAGEQIVAAGNTNLMPSPNEIPADGYWAQDSVTFVSPIEGATNSPMTVLPPPPADFTNGPRGFPRVEPRPDETNSTNITADLSATNLSTTNLPLPSLSATNVTGETATNNRPRGGGRGRPPWLRRMTDADYTAYIAKNELHGLVLTMSTENFQAICTRDLWMRFIIVFFAGISALVAGLAWRNTSKTSELQIRLVRASELNSHLKEMNLAAAGLAHETRNPLNIIRGMAQMLSKESTAPVEIREKARAIVDETDKVTVQLNEFINYSRPREVRRTKLALNSAVAEVMRALSHDIDEKKIILETTGDLISIEADEQLLRQVLFNLLLNAVQAVGGAGEIQVVTGKENAAEAFLEIRDNGPGVPPERRQEIFKPYFTTHQKGTGLGLAVVQQIILAHGWEIECLPNNPKGAIFRITHLKLVG